MVNLNECAHLWDAFCNYARESSIGDPLTESHEDWNPWWLCFLAGSRALEGSTLKKAQAEETKKAQPAEKAQPASSV